MFSGERERESDRERERESGRESESEMAADNNIYQAVLQVSYYVNFRYHVRIFRVKNLFLVVLFF